MVPNFMWFVRQNLWHTEDSRLSAKWSPSLPIFVYQIGMLFICLPFEIPFSVVASSKTTTSRTGLIWDIVSIHRWWWWRNYITASMFCSDVYEQTSGSFWCSLIALWLLCGRINLKLKMEKELSGEKNQTKWTMLKPLFQTPNKFNFLHVLL
jgi:hypothetical protein